jgi:hypothetical protein
MGIREYGSKGIGEYGNKRIGLRGKWGRQLLSA